MGTRQFIGIDFGAEALKCVVLSGTANALRVDACHTAKLPPFSTESAAEWREAAVTTLTKWRDEIGFGATPVCINPRESETLIRALKVGADASSEEVAQAIDEQLPYSLEEIEYDKATVGEKDDTSQLLVAAAKKETIEDILALCDEAGIAVETITASSVAVGNVLLHGTCAQPTALLDFGAASCSLTVVDGDKMWVRNIPVTGKSLVDSLVKELSMSEEDARAALQTKVQLQNETDEADQITACVRKALTRLVMEITRSLTFYRTQFGGNKIEKIVLTGGFSLISGMPHFLQERAKIPTELCAAFAGMEGAPEASLANLTVPALGLALQNAGIAPYALTLMPQAIQAQRALDKKKPFVLAAAYLLVAGLAVLFVLARSQATQAREVNEEESARLRRLQSIDRQITEARSSIEAQLEKNRAMERLLIERDMYPRLIQEVAERIPTNMWLSGVQSITFGDVYEREATMTMPGADRAFIPIEDPAVLRRVVRVVFSGGYYGRWTEVERDILRTLTAIPGVARVEQRSLTPYREYVTFELAFDLDIHETGKTDVENITQAHAPQTRDTRRR